MRRGFVTATRVAARRLSSSSSSHDVRAAVLRLAESRASADLGADLPAKFDLLTACEREFGLVMPHAALNDVASVDDVVRYFEARLDAAADAEAAAARHFSVAHPSNVVIGGKGRKGELRRWMRKNAKTPKAAAPPSVDDGDDEYYDEAEEDALEEELGRQAEAERAARAPGQSA